MCCLFGLIDYHQNMTAKQKNRILSVLATACEKRGTDATGIAYNSQGRMRIYKRPIPAHWMRIIIPEDAYAIMGHTRMTTQGSESFNYNNHPFSGMAGKTPFALAHNGVLYNDDTLRHTLSLPKTKIETDSYVGVQLIERQRTLDFSALQYMAEQVRGSFTFTVLSSDNSLYIVKGDNPMCLYHFPKQGMYLYASTEKILTSALKRLGISTKKAVKVPLCNGDILRITADGSMEHSSFRNSYFFYDWDSYTPFSYSRFLLEDNDSHLKEIKSVASAFGYTPEEIDHLAQLGFSSDEIEDFLYSGEL